MMFFFMMIALTFISGLFLISIDGKYNIGLILLIVSSSLFALWICLACFVIKTKQSSEVHPSKEHPSGVKSSEVHLELEKV
jgi:hypothetical protein